MTAILIQIQHKKRRLTNKIEYKSLSEYTYVHVYFARTHMCTFCTTYHTCKYHIAWMTRCSKATTYISTPAFYNACFSCSKSKYKHTHRQLLELQQHAAEIGCCRRACVTRRTENKQHSTLSPLCIIGIAGRPGGVSGYPRAWYRSVSWVRIPPNAYLYTFVGTFSCAQIDLRKARERELATLDEKSTSSGIAEPFARQKLKARTGGKGRHLWPRLVHKLESRSVEKEKKKKDVYTFVSALLKPFSLDWWDLLRSQRSHFEHACLTSLFGEPFPRLSLRSLQAARFQCDRFACQIYGSDPLVRRKNLAGQSGLIREMTRISRVMTRPDPVRFENLLTRPDPTRDIPKPLDPIRNPRDFKTSWPDPTREISEPLDPTREVLKTSWPVKSPC